MKGFNTRNFDGHIGKNTLQLFSRHSGVPVNVRIINSMSLFDLFTTERSIQKEEEDDFPEMKFLDMHDFDKRLESFAPYYSILKLHKKMRETRIL